MNTIPKRENSRKEGRKVMEYENWNNSQYYEEYENRYGAGGAKNSDSDRETMKRVRKSFSRVGLIYIAFLAVSNLSQGAVMLLVFKITASIKHLSQNTFMLLTMLTMLSMYPLAVPLTALLMKLVPSAGQVGNEQWSFGKLCGFFTFSMGILYAGNMIGTILMTAAGILKGEPIVNDVQEMILTMEPWLILIVAVIVAPIMEELVFRKFLLDRIAGFGHWTAMTVSGVIFGIAHGNFYQFFYAFGLGMVFSYIYLHTGKIIYTIVFHILINFCGSILPIFLLNLMEKHLLLGGFLTIGNLMVMFGFMICALILWICCRKDLFFWNGVIDLPAGKKRAAVWGNLGMILFLLCGVWLFSLAM